MVSIIISCSVNQEEKAFLEDYNLSPSQLLKEKIWEMKGIFIKLSKDKIQKLQSVIQQQGETISTLENENTTLRKTEKISED